MKLWTSISKHRTK